MAEAEAVVVVVEVVVMVEVPSMTSMSILLYHPPGGASRALGRRGEDRGWRKDEATPRGKGGDVNAEGGNFSK
ncbi:unnamed protein product [Gadus morhua 'NCC']